MKHQRKPWTLSSTLIYSSSFPISVPFLWVCFSQKLFKAILDETSASLEQMEKSPIGCCEVQVLDHLCFAM